MNICAAGRTILGADILARLVGKSTRMSAKGSIVISLVEVSGHGDRRKERPFMRNLRVWG